jgi:DNA polymerase III delta prime subunit
MKDTDKLDKCASCAEKHQMILELSVKLEEAQINLEKLSEIKSILELTKDEKLNVYIGILVEKLKERHDEAAILRLHKKISEYTFTNLTFAYELAYLAKEAYTLVIKESHGLLEPLENSEEDKGDNIDRT